MILKGNIQRITDSAGSTGVTSSSTIATNAIVKGVDGTRKVQASGVLIDGSNNISGAVAIAATGQLSTTANIVQGAASPINTTNIPTPGISALTTTGNAGFCMARFASSNGNGKIFLVKSRGATVGSNAVVQTSDGLGSIEFFGADGSDYQRGCYILATVTDPTPSSTAMGSDMRFYTAAAGAVGGTERVTIKSNGNVLFGTQTDSSNGKIQITTHTTAAGGIGFGTDVSLFRSGTALLRTNSAQLIGSSVSLTNGAAAQTGTLTNAPSAGNPTKWIPIDDNGTTRYIPAW